MGAAETVRDRPRILIVDDEPHVRLIIERTLAPEGYQVDTAADGAEAIARLRQHDYDVLLLDLQMEPMGGVEVLEASRQACSDLVVLILTAHGTLDSAVAALRLGAFDYLFKPASPETIRQRVRAGLAQRQQLLRRRQLLKQVHVLRETLSELETEPEDSAPPAERRFLRSGRLTIDRHHRVASLDGRALDLTTAEFNLLVGLAETAPEAVSPRQLVKAALGYDVEHSEARETAKWYIHHLRQKIEPDPAQPRYILTVRHQGYLWRG